MSNNICFQCSSKLSIIRIIYPKNNPNQRCSIPSIQIKLYYWPVAYWVQWVIIL